MKLLIISDIHGNLDALKSVLKYTETLSIDEIYCCGDLCGYFTQVNEIVDLLKTYNVISIKGNHDAFLVNELPLNKTRSYFKSHIKTRKIISDKALFFVKNLPLTTSVIIDGLQINLYHGGANDLLSESVYPDTISINDYSASVNIFGHTHLQFAVNFQDQLFLNPGSIGLPRNGDFRPHFLTLNTLTKEVQEYRIKYDVNKIVNNYGTLNSNNDVFLHNLNFGRSSKKKLRNILKDNLLKNTIDHINPKISIINTKFGFILSKNDFQNSDHIIYIAFYEDKSIEITSSTLVFHWQINLNLKKLVHKFINLLKSDSAGFYYFKIYCSENEFLENISKELESTFNITTKFELKNVKI